MTKLQLEPTKLTEADLEDFEEEDEEESLYRKPTKVLVVTLIIIAIVALAILGFCVGVILKDMLADDNTVDEVLGAITVEDENGTTVNYTTSEDTCVFILKFTTPGVYTCVILEKNGDDLAARKGQTLIVQDITDEYTVILNKYDVKTDYVVRIHKSAVGDNIE